MKSAEVKSQKSYRNICFTLNNWTQDEFDSIKALKFSYLVMGKEIGERCTPHLQGYIEFKSSKSFDLLKKWFPRAHLEKRYGTSLRASNYCKKGIQSKTEWHDLHEDGPTFGVEADFLELGELSNQGKRSDLDDVVETLLETKSTKEVVDNHPNSYIRYHRGINAFFQAKFLEPKMRPDLKVHYLWGPTGSGKTYYVFKHHQHDDIYIKDANNKWWDGYNGQSVVLIDDLRHSIESFEYMLRLLDTYPFRGEVKGGYCGINCRTIYITSDRPPDRIWRIEDDENNLAQIMRRFSTVTEMGRAEVGPEVGGNTKLPLSEFETY